jgi:TolB-like protein
MQLERWEKIEQLYHAALECAPDGRAAFLDAACGGDQSLRREVESLLAYDEPAQRFIAQPPDAIAAELLAAEPAPALIGSRLNQYQILARLGRGGMGEVYLASDTRLGRKVALKLLPAEFTRDAERMRRFEQEARTASALNHPNIITIHEIGAVDQHQFIVSEFVEGETLRQRIKSGPLELETALEIAVQVASALEAAHRAGIVHRDIKPENVMLRPDGLVKVLDFGLAKLTGAAAPTADLQAETLARLSTETGVVMGTVHYMSPEQARGLKVDQRSDIFSLGVMLYEILAGRRPFEGATTSDVIVTLLTAEPSPLRQHCAGATAELEQVVGKCLAKEREARYQAADELLAELKKLQVGGQPETAATRKLEAAGARLALRRSFVLFAIAAVLLLGLVYRLSQRQAPTVQPNQIKALAVLPLENLSGDPQQEYFADGMTEALISNLTQVRALRVISRTSVMRFKGGRKSLQEIARKLGVDAVIEGSVRRAGERVKITARLIQAVNETPLRSFDYERELADVLKLQSDVARAVADEIQIRVTAEERARLAAAPRVKPEAYVEYLLGRYHLYRYDEENLKLASDHFERAIQLDASYAAAWAGLSDAWRSRGIFGAKSFREVEQPAREAALKALVLDANSAEAYTSLGDLKSAWEWNWAGAEQDYRRALALDPASVDAHRLFAFLLSALGRHTEALSHIQTAERLDPLSARVQDDFGRMLYRARNYAEAERHLKRAIALGFLARGRLADVYEQTGRYAEALDIYETGRGSGNVFSIASRARLYAKMGRREEARRLLKDLQRTTYPRFPRMHAATAWAALGDKDEAFRPLFSAVEQRDNLLVFLKVDPKLDDLRSDPRWKELLRRMNFPED